MPVHGAHGHLLKRQDPLSHAIASSIDGVSGALTVGTAAATASSLLINSAAGATPSQNAQAAVPSTIVPTPSSAGAAAPTDAGDNSQSSTLSTGAVIGACVGAFIVFAAVVMMAHWYFRRPLKRKPSARPHGDSGHPGHRPMALSPLAKSLNAQAEAERLRANGGKAPYHAFNDSREDVFAAEKISPVPSAHTKLSSMFNKTATPSLHSVEADRMSTLTHDLSGDASFSKYHPFLAEELAMPPLPLIDRGVSHARSESWGSETIAGDSYLGTKSTQPSFGLGKTTPSATFSDAESHKWESGEVGHVDTHRRTPSSKSNGSNRNPFDDPTSHTESSPGRSRNIANPFFSANAQSMPTRKRAPSNPSNPFTNSAAVANITVVPPPSLPAAATERSPTHGVADSVASNTSDHALASLIAALNVSPEEVQERLRIASMQSLQPSIVSTLASGDEDDNNIDDFPLPPASSLYPPSRS